MTSSSPRAADRRGSYAAQRIAVYALAVELLVLAATGIALFVLYRPSAGAADVASGTVVSVLRGAHRVVATAAVLTALGAAVTFAATVLHGRLVTLGVGGLLVGTVGSAQFTGHLLPWDQLALWAVTAGGGMNGYRPMFDDRVRFVLMGGTEVGTDTVVRWLGIHTLVLSPLAALLVVALWRRRSQALSREDPPVAG